MTPLAVVLLAHADPPQLRRLVGALEDVPIVLHVDASVPPREHAALVDGLPDRVLHSARVHATLHSWSLVRAELLALEQALRETDARHIAVLSGSDYPLLSMPEIRRELEAWAEESWITNIPLPQPDWSTPRHPDGGRWRFDHRFLLRGDNVLYVGKVPLRLPWRRRLPAELTLRAGSQWKIYARHDAERLLGLVRDRPEILGFWRTTLVPEESFVHSVLADERYFGADRLTPCYDSPWYLEWDPANPGHPRWLTAADFETLRTAASLPSLLPADRRAEKPAPGDGRRRLFARKFSSRVDHDVLDRVDAELRSQ